ncbi:MAG: crossover junction endodeoxyribonuclease RuvC [Candidatus Paceibacterota bacterium]|jgi:crossover junction endodeoxyribonuclease RuvC
MLILGIDPGTTRIGYSLIKKTPKDLELIECGVYTTKATDMQGRLSSLAKNLRKTLKNFSPDLIAMERIFFFKNKKTAFEIAQAVGVMTLLSAQFKITQVQYTPLEIKQTITGYGLSEKEEVAAEVFKILRIKKLEGYDDMTDAIAITLTAICRFYYKNKSFYEELNSKSNKKIKKGRLNKK